MRNKLQLFKSFYIQNKAELLLSLSRYREYCLSDSKYTEGWSASKNQAILSLLDQFVRQIQQTELPDLDHWWFYNYHFTRFELVLELCHCKDIVYDADGAVSEMTTDENLPLVIVSCEMISLSAFASRHQVKPITVRQWIRRGKLRAIRKQGRDWIIAAMADRPSRTYDPVMYSWRDNDALLVAQFPYLEGIHLLYINQKKSDKSVFRIHLGEFGSEGRWIEVSHTEREKLELALLSRPDIQMEDSSTNIQFVPCKEILCEIPERIFASASEEDFPYYGPVIVTEGPHKGQIGCYDDDEDESGSTYAIVYFGDMLLLDHYYLLPYEYISNVIPTINIIDRMQELYREIHYAAKNYKYQSRGLQELHYCSNLLNERYVSAMNKLHENSNHIVFISHATEDLSFARALATDLMQEGYMVFLDDWSVDLGENIVSRISEAIQNSHSLIMLISQHYLKSVFCSDEWTAFYMLYTKKKQNSLYPIILDESDPPALISTIKYARMRNSEEYQQSLDQLLRALKKHNTEQKKDE